MATCTWYNIGHLRAPVRGPNLIVSLFHVSCDELQQPESGVNLGDWGLK